MDEKISDHLHASFLIPIHKAMHLMHENVGTTQYSHSRQDSKMTAFNFDNRIDGGPPYRPHELNHK